MSFFWLKKFISFWLMPLPFCLALLVVGLILLGLGRRLRLGRALVMAGLGLLLFFSNRAVSSWLIRPLEMRHPSQLDGAPSPELATCRYIVVLGGGHNESPGLSATNRLSGPSLSRAVEAFRLAQLLPGAELIATGPPGRENGDSHAAVVGRAIAALGLDASRLRPVETAHDTEDEANAVRRLVGDAPVALVTSAWHMPRAAGLFRGAGVTVVPCPTDYMSKPHGAGWRQLACDVESLSRSTLAVRETIGLTWVRLRGKLGSAP